MPPSSWRVIHLRMKPNQIKILSKTLTKLITLAVLLAIITPVLYFAWHMGQPLSQPEFNGLTYYQFIEWRKMAYEERAMQYQASHPTKKADIRMCENNTRTITILLLPLQSFGYMVTAFKGAKPDATHTLPEGVTLSNFLPKWWDTFEYIFWYNTIHLNGLQNTLVEYCRIQPNIPTPAEFEVMKLEYAANTSVSP